MGESGFLRSGGSGNLMGMENGGTATLCLPLTTVTIPGGLAPGLSP